MKAPAALAGVVLLLLAPARAAAQQQRIEAEEITPGLVYAPYKVENLTAHVLKLDLTAPKLFIRSLKAEGKETLRTMVDRLNRSGERVIGAVNGDFFHRSTAAGVPYGAQVSDGSLIFGPRKRSVIAFGPDNKPAIGIVDLKCEARIDGRTARGAWLPVDGVNVFPDEFEKRTGILLYTPQFQKAKPGRIAGVFAVIDRIEPALQVGGDCRGEVSRVDASGEEVEVPGAGCLLYLLGDHARELAGRIEAGTEIALRISLPPIRGSVPQAIGGGPRLVRSGRKSVEFDKEDFDRLHVLEIDRKRHPRSAVGYDRVRKHLFLVVVEGRHDGSAGMTMDELADFLVRLGCYDAMGFDGGGSAAMYALGRGIVSKSVGGGGREEEREIANSLLITMERQFPAKAPEKAPEKDGGAGEAGGKKSEK